MNYQQAQNIKDKINDVYDGVYIGKYNLTTVKPKLEAVITELESGNDKGKRIAQTLRTEVLPNTAIKDTDANEIIFCRSMNDPLTSIDLWVIDYAPAGDEDPR